MARFLVGTMPIIGHVNPGIPIVRKLVERGHEVWWYTGKAFQNKVESTGARYIAIRGVGDYSDLNTIPEWFKQKQESLDGLELLKFYLKYAFIDSGIVQLKDFSEILQEFPADIILADSYFIGASWVSQKLGIPWAAFGSSGLTFQSRDTAPFGLGMTPDTSIFGRIRNRSLNWLFNQVLLKDVTVYLDKVRSDIGLQPKNQSFFDAILSPFLYLQGTVSMFEYPRSDLPAQVHFIGPLLPEPPNNFTPPSWWEELKINRPVIHVTQGTVSTEVNDLIIPTIQGLADENILLVVTTGGQPIESLTQSSKLAKIPENVRIEPFISHHYLLPHIDVMITNGGYNGVQMALANGVPMVAAGNTEEKPEVNARIEWTGVGINLKTKTPSPTQIKNAVKKILSTPQYRHKAQIIQTEIARSDAASKAVDLLEQLVGTKQPVFR